MVYFGTGKGGVGKGPGGISKISVGAGPFKITSNKPSLRKQVINVKKSVKEIRNKEELKYLDTFMNGTAITTAGVLILLNGMTLGDTVSNRQGDSITPTSIQCRFTGQASATIDEEAFVRHIVFWDSQPNGAAPSVGDVLDGATITSLYTCG